MANAGNAAQLNPDSSGEFIYPHGINNYFQVSVPLSCTASGGMDDHILFISDSGTREDFIVEPKLI